MDQNEKRISLISVLLSENGYELYNDYNNYNLFSLLRAKNERAFLFLELYSVSISAYLSEINSRKKNLSNSTVKFYYRLFLSFYKLFIFKIFVKKNSLIIVPSKLRKKFLEGMGFSNIVVVKNKPVVPIETSKKRRKMLLSGNLRSLDRFKQFYDDCCESIHIDAIGVNESTKLFLNENYPDVSVQNRVENNVLLKELSESACAIVSYDGYSTNQILSASSKVFEIYNASCVVIINNNPGLVFECIEEEIPYIIYDGTNSALDLIPIIEKNNNEPVVQKLFLEELKKLKVHIKKNKK